jgi:thiol-disulfide isomerase/thioredoxin
MNGKLKRKNKALAFVISTLFLVSICGCQSQIKSKEAINEIQKWENFEFQLFNTVSLYKDGTFPFEECASRNLEDKVMMVGSKYCGHCRATLPFFKEACSEKEVEAIILDITEKEQRQEIESYGLNIKYFPTFIFGCNYYIGAKSKDEYLKLLDEFLGKESDI